MKNSDRKLSVKDLTTPVPQIRISQMQRNAYNGRASVNEKTAGPEKKHENSQNAMDTSPPKAPVSQPETSKQTPSVIFSYIYFFFLLI